MVLYSQYNPRPNDYRFLVSNLMDLFMASHLLYYSFHIHYHSTSLVLYNLFSVQIQILLTALPTLSLMALNIYEVLDLSENLMRIVELLS